MSRATRTTEPSPSPTRLLATDTSTPVPQPTSPPLEEVAELVDSIGPVYSHTSGTQQLCLGCAVIGGIILVLTNRKRRAAKDEDNSEAD